MRKVLLVCMIILGSMGITYSLDDTYWDNRNSEEGVKAAYDFYKKAFETQKDYESAWKFSRVAYFYADVFTKKDDTKKALFTESKDAAEAATNLNYKGPDGHYYLGVSLGAWAEANGIFKSLFTVPDLVREADKVVELDPKYNDGDAYVFRGRIYQKAPGGISVGDGNKAEADYIKAIALNPNNRTVLRFYAELLLDRNKTKAKEIIEKGLALPLDIKDKSNEEKEIRNLKELQKKL